MPAVRMNSPWLPLTAESVEAAGGQLGVYQIAGADGTVCRIGAAGGRNLFGLRSALTAELERFGDGMLFRVERTSAYRSRHLELLMVHLADHGNLPAGNDEDPERLGRLSPA